MDEEIAREAHEALLQDDEARLQTDNGASQRLKDHFANGPPENSDSEEQEADGDSDAEPFHSGGENSSGRDSDDTLC